MNYRFHIEEWLARFPLQMRHGRYHGEAITSPWHICQNENLRREMHAEFEWGTAVPVDIFIMSDGEPTDRHNTKIGGLPYRPAHAKWPARNGAPLVFLAQINFSDSKDLTGELPGDVLLVFADNVDAPEYLHFEWQRLGMLGLIEPDGIPAPSDVNDPATLGAQQQFLDLVKKQFGDVGLTFPKELDEIPPRKNVIAPCYGHIFRAASYPDATAHDDSTKYPLCNGTEVWAWYFMLQYQATQIGGAPFFIQQGDPQQINGRLLCTISTVQPAFDVEFPWINRQTPIPLFKRREAGDNYLMIGDAGCVYISMDNRGQVHGHWSCY